MIFVFDSAGAVIIGFCGALQPFITTVTAATNNIFNNILNLLIFPFRLFVIRSLYSALKIKDVKDDHVAKRAITLNLFFTGKAILYRYCQVLTVIFTKHYPLITPRYKYCLTCTEFYHISIDSCKIPIARNDHHHFHLAGR